MVLGRSGDKIDRRTLSNLASTLSRVGRLDESLDLHRQIHASYKAETPTHSSIIAAQNLALSLSKKKRFDEARALLLETIPTARRALGDEDEITLRTEFYYAEMPLDYEEVASLDELRDSQLRLAKLDRTASRVLGPSHPIAMNIKIALDVCAMEVDHRASIVG